MGAKKLVARENETLVTLSRKPATAAVIMESGVATEAELCALWADMDRNAEVSVRNGHPRNGIS